VTACIASIFTGAIVHPTKNKSLNAAREEIVSLRDARLVDAGRATVVAAEVESVGNRLP
jgi:hypothetical protein